MSRFPKLGNECKSMSPYALLEAQEWPTVEFVPSGSTIAERIPSGSSRRASMVGHSHFYRPVVSYCMADCMFPTVDARQLVGKHVIRPLLRHELPRVSRSGICCLTVFLNPSGNISSRGFVA